MIRSYQSTVCTSYASVVVIMSALIYLLADFQGRHSQSYRKQMDCDLNVRRLRMKSKFWWLWILPFIACEKDVWIYRDMHVCFHCMLHKIATDWALSDDCRTLDRKPHDRRTKDCRRMTAVFFISGHFAKYVLLDKWPQILFLDRIQIYFSIQNI